MSDTQIMRAPFSDDESPAESELVALRDAPDPARAPSESSAESVSVIGETLHFKGELSAGEDLVIEGKVEGSINQGKCCLTVKPNGHIIASVNATRIFIEGKVEGDLSATVSVTVSESGVVDGNIIAPRVAITEGATFNGNIRMQSPDEGRGD